MYANLWQINKNAPQKILNNNLSSIKIMLLNKKIRVGPAFHKYYNLGNFATLCACETHHAPKIFRPQIHAFVFRLVFKILNAKKDC